MMKKKKEKETKAKKEEKPEKPEITPEAVNPFAGMSVDDIEALIDEVINEVSLANQKQINEIIDQGEEQANKNAEKKRDEGKKPVDHEKAIDQIVASFQEAGIMIQRETVEGLYNIFGEGRVKMSPDMDEGAHKSKGRKNK